MNPTDWTIFAIAVCVMLAGVLGTVVPFLPGLPLIWGTMLVYGIIEEFSNVNAVFLVVTFAVVLVTEAADYFARALGCSPFRSQQIGRRGSRDRLRHRPVFSAFGPDLGALSRRRHRRIDGRTFNFRVRPGRLGRAHRDAGFDRGQVCGGNRDDDRLCGASALSAIGAETVSLGVGAW